ncbi:MAG TPA: PQQ-binding-like beta-propeller repeat protein, partial [Candidatus Aquilonibacter sp.]|nr:PQQ-binding-like beta-propeller repeat protein [Candidatus Aquilonibacter sp.]
MIARRLVTIAASLALLAGCNGGTGAQWPAVTDARLRNADKDPGWLMYLRTYNAQGHAPYNQINAGNVDKLHVVFTHSVSIPEGFEAPPMVNGRTMIVTTPMDDVYALDAVTGKKLWEYDHAPDIPKVTLRTVCCDMDNRGVAMYGNNVYMATLDDHVIALDARTGKVVWDVTKEPPGVGYAMTAAPLAVNGKIIIGAGGGEYGSRGVIFALDAKDGHELWRFYTIPSPHQTGGNTWPNNTYKHGGADPWMTGSYDPETNTLFWGTGNPSPWLWVQHPGQNLFSDSFVALDPDTGKLKFWFQETPNDPWDYDATATWVQADVPIKGKMRKIIYQFGRNGNLYVVDRTNGDLIYMTPFTKAMSVLGYDRKKRMGIVDEQLKPRIGQAIVTCPAFFGGDNWWSFTYDPNTHIAVTPGMQTCMKLTGEKPPKKFNAGAFQT